MDQMVEVPCNLCGANDAEPISTQGQFGLPVNVVLCRRCGLAYLSPRWTKERYLDFYEREFDRHYRPAMLAEDWRSEPARLNPLVERLATEGFFERSAQHVLDIGSGEGRNLSDLRKQFPRASFWAIEPSERSRQLLERNGFRVLARDVDARWDSVEAGFDLVVMRHVLEHFLNPLAVLTRVKDVLAPEGLVYIAVPNSLAPRPPIEGQWFRVVHAFYFNAHSLMGLLARAGLEAVRLIEGDEHHRHELVVMARRAAEPPSFTPLPQSYAEQRKVFLEAIGRDRALHRRFRRRLGQWLGTRRSARFAIAAVRRWAGKGRTDPV